MRDVSSTHECLHPKDSLRDIVDSLESEDLVTTSDRSDTGLTANGCPVVSDRLKAVTE